MERREEKMNQGGGEEETVVAWDIETVISSRPSFLTLVRACPKRFSNAFKLR